MGLLIRHLTTEAIDALSKERKFAINTLGISFEYQFALDSVNLNWYDLLYAIDNGYLSHLAAVEHAQHELGFEEIPDVLELAILAPQETIYPQSIQPYISYLADRVSENEKKYAKQKLQYLVLKWMYERQADFKNILEAVEFIYADFGHPQNMASFIRYMPSMRPILATADLRTDQMLKNWASFLIEQESIFGK